MGFAPSTSKAAIKEQKTVQAAVDAILAGNGGSYSYSLVRRDVTVMSVYIIVVSCSLSTCTRR